ncbi:SDR family oxidoreductase [Streptomyces roseofulvus]
MSTAGSSSISVTDSRVLVTGGFGFIGSWLAHKLVADGNSVTLLDIASPAGSCAEALGLTTHPDVRCVIGDLMDPGAFSGLGTEFTHIVHAAGFLGIHKVVEQPVATLDVNILATRTVLEFARAQQDLKRVVLFSTSEVYGQEASDVSETDPAVVGTDSTRWGYAASKLAVEFYGRAYHEHHHVPVVTVRPFNVYGPHRAGSNAMTALVSRALRGEELHISGDGSQSRAWCEITDFVDGLIRCLAMPEAVGEIFNLGDDKTALSLLELAEKIVDLTSSASSIRVIGDAVPDVRSRRPVIDKARTILGYAPSTSVDEGITAVVRAMRETADGVLAQSAR